MATLELTITPDYVNWGAWESIREICQNTADAHDQGFPMTVTYKKGRGGTLEFRNVGIRISRDKLLLGASDKRDDTKLRGQFGEGMKLAWASLLRLGKRIRIRNDDEIWTPELGYSTNFDAELLKIKTSKTKSKGDVCVFIHGIAPDEWEGIQKRLLFLTPPDSNHVIDVYEGEILTEEKYRDLLFVKGIFVCNLPDRYHYGYNLRNVEIDRDRKLAEPWSLKSEIRRAITHAVEKEKLLPEEVLEILDDQGCGEAKVFDSEQYYSKSEFHRKVAAAFTEVHGDNAAPVTAMGDSVEAKHHGIKGIMVTEPLKNVIEKDLGTFEDRKIVKATSPKIRYTAEDLTEEEMNNLNRAVSLIADVTTLTLNDIQIVDFIGPDVIGTHETTDGIEIIRLARRILTKPGRLITALAHEVSHRVAADGTVEFRDTQDAILGVIIEKNCWPTE